MKARLEEENTLEINCVSNYEYIMASVKPAEVGLLKVSWGVQILLLSVFFCQSLISLLIDFPATRWYIILCGETPGC